MAKIKTFKLFEGEDVLETLIAKDVNDLSEDDKAFIRARQPYLNDADKERFKKLGILNPPVAKAVEPTK